LGKHKTVTIQPI